MISTFKMARPPCATCKHFKNNKCTAFAPQDPVSGSVTYYKAIDIRLDETKCGTSGKWYVKKYCPKPL